MNEIYMNISIVYYRDGHTICHFCESINDGPINDRELELNKARRLAWELVLAGGKRTVRNNIFDPTITMVDVNIFLPN